MKQDVIEQKVLSHIFGDLLAPHRIAHVARAVEEAIPEGTRLSDDDKVRHEAALREARRELDNIASAIRQGIITSTTKTMLEDAEHRVAAAEASIRAVTQRRAPVVVVKTAIERYVSDLRSTLGTDIDAARRLLAKGFDRIVLQRDEDGHLWAEVQGNLAGLLNLEAADLVAGGGAGSPVPMLPSTVMDRRIVA